MDRAWRVVVAMMVAGSVMLAVGCERTEPSDAQREAIEAAVQGYLSALAESYSSLSVEPLEGHASAREMAAVRDLLEGLVASGDRVEATLLNFEVDALEVFRGVNATVRLVEVWQVVRYDAFTGAEKGRNPSSVQHTILNLRKVDGEWLVTARIITERDSGEGEGVAAGGSGTAIGPGPTAEGGQ